MQVPFSRLAVVGRTTVARMLSRVSPTVVAEYVAPAAASVNAIKLAIASVASVQSYSGVALDGATGPAVMSPPRNVTVTTAGSTASDASATATIKGTDVNGAALSETITVSQTAATAAGAKMFATVTEIDLPAADGTGATLAFGFGAILGLPSKGETRAGGLAVFGESVNGARPATAGVYASSATAPPNGSYAPNTAPDASHSYAILYELAAPV